jgi:hypothetical protein
MVVGSILTDPMRVRQRSWGLVGGVISKKPTWFGLLNVDDSGELSNRALPWSQNVVSEIMVFAKDADHATSVFGRREVHVIGRNIRTDGRLWSTN